MEAEEMIEFLRIWAVGQRLSKDPRRISKLYNEARRRWAHLMSRYRIGLIVDATLRALRENEDSCITA